MNTDTQLHYHSTITRLLALLAKDELSTEDKSEIADIREAHSWDGLSCGCGGGWLVGHRAGCPEREADKGHGWICYNGGPGSMFWMPTEASCQHELSEDIRPATALEKMMFARFGKAGAVGYELTEEMLRAP